MLRIAAGSPRYPVDKDLVADLSQWFGIAELVPPAALVMGEECWSLFDPRLLRMLLTIRESWGKPLTINGSGRTLCGWRPLDCSIGAAKSAHKLGQAVDLHPASWRDMDELWDAVYSSAHCREIEAIQDTPSWVHASVRGGAAGIRIVRK